jgi:hypothetical protein
MLLLEASVNEHSLAVPWNDDVGCAGQISMVQAKAITELMRGTAHPQLRAWCWSCEIRRM